MSLFLFSILSAITQSLLIVALSRAIGPAQYAVYSLSFSISAFGAGLVFEWLRLLIPKYSGTRSRRAATWLMESTRRTVDLLSGATICVGAFISAALLVTGHQKSALCVAASACLIAASGLTDTFSMYLRFHHTPRIFNAVTLARSLTSGVVALVVGALTASGFWSCIAFAVASSTVSLSLRQLYWREPPSFRRRPRSLANVARYGICASVSTIATNFAFAAGRGCLAFAVSPVGAGRAFLTLDLLTRGVIVLGTALSTWGAKPIFDAAHKSRAAAQEAFGNVASPFVCAWLSLAFAGGMAAFALPLLLDPRVTEPGLAQLLVCNMVAVWLIGIRLYLLDPLLVAIGRVQEVALAAAILAAVSGAGLAASALWRYEALGYCLPLAVAASTVTYMARNLPHFKFGAMRGVATLAAAKVVVLIMLFAFSDWAATYSYWAAGFAVSLLVDTMGFLAMRALLLSPPAGAHPLKRTDGRRNG